MELSAAQLAVIAAYREDLKAMANGTYAPPLPHTNFILNDKTETINLVKQLNRARRERLAAMVA